MLFTIMVTSISALDVRGPEVRTALGGCCRLELTFPMSFEHVLHGVRLKLRLVTLLEVDLFHRLVG